MHLLSRVIQSVCRYLEKIFIIIRNRTQKTVFKLFTAPGFGINSTPFPGNALSTSGTTEFGSKMTK